MIIPITQVISQCESFKIFEMINNEFVNALIPSNCRMSSFSVISLKCFRLANLLSFLNLLICDRRWEHITRYSPNQPMTATTLFQSLILMGLG